MVNMDLVYVQCQYSQVDSISITKDTDFAHLFSFLKKARLPYSDFVCSLYHKLDDEPLAVSHASIIAWIVVIPLSNWLFYHLGRRCLVEGTLRGLPGAEEVEVGGGRLGDALFWRGGTPSEKGDEADAVCDDRGVGDSVLPVAERTPAGEASDDPLEMDVVCGLEPGLRLAEARNEASLPLWTVGGSARAGGTASGMEGSAGTTARF